jgi:hypothetical protein
MTQEGVNFSLRELTCFEPRNNDRNWNCWRETAHPRGFDFARLLPVSGLNARADRNSPAEINARFSIIDC